MFCKFEDREEMCTCTECANCGDVCPLCYGNSNCECPNAVLMGDCFEKVAYEMKKFIETRPQLLWANYSVRYKTIVFRMENFKDFFVYFLKSIAEECNVELRACDYTDPLYDVARLLCKLFQSDTEEDIKMAEDIVYEISEEIEDGKYDFIVPGLMEDKWYVI